MHAWWTLWQEDELLSRLSGLGGGTARSKTVRFASHSSHASKCASRPRLLLPSMQPCLHRGLGSGRGRLQSSLLRSGLQRARPGGRSAAPRRRLPRPRDTSKRASRPRLLLPSMQLSLQGSLGSGRGRLQSSLLRSGLQRARPGGRSAAPRRRLPRPRDTSKRASRPRLLLPSMQLSLQGSLKSGRGRLPTSRLRSGLQRARPSRRSARPR